LQNETSVTEAWRGWGVENLKTARLRKLGPERLDLSHGRRGLVELFTRDAADVTAGYGRFSHAATSECKASVVDGMLRLEEGAVESDQRLEITSQKLIGRNEWPPRLEVRAKMEGEQSGSGAWHVGLSVGNVRCSIILCIAGVDFGSRMW